MDETFEDYRGFDVEELMAAVRRLAPAPPHDN